MPVARTPDNLSAIDEIISQSRRSPLKKRHVTMSLRAIEGAFLLIASVYIIYQVARETGPMSEPQGVILRTLVEKVATLHSEPAGKVWADIRGDMAIPRDSTLSRAQWRSAVDALAVEIDRY